MKEVKLGMNTLLVDEDGRVSKLRRDGIPRPVAGAEVPVAGVGRATGGGAR